MCTYYPCKKQSSRIISSLLVQQLLTTLVEIQRIAYSPKAEGTPKSVLRLHDRTWYHGILCREVFGFKLKEITTRKLYGNYYHYITCHNNFQYNHKYHKINIILSPKPYQWKHLHHTASSDASFSRLYCSFSKQKTSFFKVAAFLPSYVNTIIPQQVTEKHIRSSDHGKLILKELVIFSCMLI
jgi:hypothetical protein